MMRHHSPIERLGLRRTIDTPTRKLLRNFRPPPKGEVGPSPHTLCFDFNTAIAARTRLPLAGRPKPRSGFGWGSTRGVDGERVDDLSAQRGGADQIILVILVIVALLAAGCGRGSPDSPGEVPGDPPADDPGDDPGDEPDAPLTDADGRVFSYLPVGDLLPSSGPGFVDDTVYRADLVFPTEDPVYLNSQVYRYGGMNGALNGMNGAQCDARNYEYPWQDTFCERRDRNQPLCPGGGHEGLDIRPHTCNPNVHYAVAVEPARVVDIRRHWVTLQTADGAIYNYLHLNMGALEVEEGDMVAAGDRIGLISNDFFASDGTRTPTTTHLHFEMYANYVASAGDDPLFTKVNPYMTLVSAYDRKLRE